MKRRNMLAVILIGSLLIIGLGIGSLMLWASNSHSPMPEALESLESDSQVQVETDRWITFVPLEAEPSTGFIFYPGGLVEPEAYAPTARAIAEAGYLVAITPMPLNLAVLNSDAAADVITAYPEIKDWVIGGHSLGGSMAATFSDQNPDQIAGLALWASYPAESNDLSDQLIEVSSIYGTLDGLATTEKVLAAKSLLPQNTVWVPIEGGNHAQFGWYGPQEGDYPATISREAQEAQILSATLALLSKIDTPNE